MPKSREDFAPDIGGFLDGVDADITSVTFAIATGQYLDKVMAGGGDAKPPVLITLTCESPDLEKPQEQSFSVGGSDVWEPDDEGKSVKNIKNPDKHGFRKGSRSYSLVEAMFLAVGGASAEDIEKYFTDTKSKIDLSAQMEKGQDFFIKRDAYMTEAPFYEGLGFSWKTIKLPTMKEGQTSNVPLPVIFLEDKNAKPAAKAKTAPTTPAKKTVAPTSGNAALEQILIDNASDKTEKELKAFAVRSAEIKANTEFLRSVVSGPTLKNLEDASKITKDPETGKYI